MSFFSRLFGKKEQPQTRICTYVPMTTIKPPAPKPAAAPAPKKQPPAGKTYKVAGVSHYSENILSMRHENDDYKMGKRALIDEGLVETRIWEYDFFPVNAELVPEPENPHDPKAIKVLVDGVHVGYIKAGSCAHLLRVINEGRIQHIDVKIGGGKYKYLEVVDYKENGDEIYELNREEVPLYVHLNIVEAAKEESAQ